MKVSIKSLVEQVVKEEISALAEAKPSGVDKKYTHFVLDKATNKILNGWDYKGYDKEDIVQHVKEDLKDMEVKPSEVSILSVQGLKKKGIDPFSWDSWKKDGANEATTTMVTPDGKTLSPEQKAKMKMAKPGTTVVVKKAGELSEESFSKYTLKVKHNNSGTQYEGTIKRSAKGWMLYDKNDSPEEAGPFNTLQSLMSYYDLKRENLTGDYIKNLKEGQDLQEKKSKEAEEEAPAENPEAPAEEAPVEDQTAGTASSELNQHISAAIDSAAKAIEASQDAKYEKVLGKVIKNLTAAQASLADVEAVENKLNEQKLKEEAKVADSFRKNLRKELKSSFKNPEHIDLILRKYDKVAKTASKENRPVQKIAEIITRHALNEGLIKKGDLLS